MAQAPVSAEGTTELRSLAAVARQRLVAGQQALTAAWHQYKQGPALLGGRSALVDGVLQEVWGALAMPANCALVAVGVPRGSQANVTLDEDEAPMDLAGLPSFQSPAGLCEMRT